jgi:periplasmic divalent cation tolerance protein
VILIYCPIGPDEARQVAQTLVEEKLAACVNLLAPHDAIYHWQGKIDEATERGMLFKTTEALRERAVARLKELHPYETPAIVWWEAGSTLETISWLEESTE